MSCLSFLSGDGYLWPIKKIHLLKKLQTPGSDSFVHAHTHARTPSHPVYKLNDIDSENDMILTKKLKEM